MKYLIFLVFATIVLVNCQSNDEPKNDKKETAEATAPDTAAPQKYIPNAAIGSGNKHPVDGRLLDQPQIQEAMKKLKPQAHNTNPDGTPILIRKVNLTPQLSEVMIEKGRDVHDAQCSGCHTLTTAKSNLISLAGTTKRRKPEWIMNMLTGVTTTLETNAAAAQKLEACPTRAPQTRLNVEQARDYLELLRSVDGI